MVFLGFLKVSSPPGSHSGFVAGPPYSGAGLLFPMVFLGFLKVSCPPGGQSAFDAGRRAAVCGMVFTALGDTYPQKRFVK